ncbi:hypothetical protein JZ751_025876 [Albula glossodonta]|uniref:Fibronectin type-III domain-containing protein n=1 Tax=Albula glossodonta TaxID=121402 RepID=A0A8T2MSV6_9TELE|nr:hypothetical protein JZ751_025876 [Albula glossodonta]
MEGVSYTYRITYTCDGEEPKEQTTTGSNSSTADLCDLKPGVEYSFTSAQCFITAAGAGPVQHRHTHSPPHQGSWTSPLCVRHQSVCPGTDPQTWRKSPTFRVTSGNSRGPRESITTDENSTVLSHLRPGTEYSISVCTVLQRTGLESEPVPITVCTEPSAPERLRVEEVRSRSVRLCWDTPTKMVGVSYTYRITYTCDGEEPKEQTTGSNSSTADLCDLKPGVEYSFSICTVLHNGSRSRAWKLEISSVCETSVCLSWDRPTDMEEVPHTFRVTWGNSREQRESITTDENPTVLSHLRPVTEYSISVCTVLQRTGLESEPVPITVCTEPSAPERLRVGKVRSRSVRLCWDTPTKMEGVSYTYRITYTCDGEEPKEQTTGSNSSTADLCDLKPGVEYSFSICTVLHNGSRSRACSAQAHTQPSPPGKLEISSVCETSVCLSWDRPTDMEGVPHTFRVTWGNSREQRESITTDENSTVLSHLRPVTEYSISVCTVLQRTGLESEPVPITVCTEPSAPERLRVGKVRSRSVRLCWDTPTKMEGVSYTYRITYTCDGEEPKEQTTGSNSSTADLCDLKPGVEYSFSICTVLHNGSRSRACFSTGTHTPTDMEEVPHTFRVTWGNSREQRESITTDENSTVLSHLRPVTEYSISVCTVLQRTGLESEPVPITVCTEPSAPERLRVGKVRSRSVRLRWDTPTKMEGVSYTYRITYTLRLCWDTPTKMEGVSYTYSITYTCDGEGPKEQTTGSNSSSADLCDLKPGVEYSFSICTLLHNGSRSRACSAQAHIQPSPPGKLNISSVCETSVCLSWDRPTDMEGLPHTFRVTWEDSRGQRESITTDENPTVLSHLRPVTEYSISVCTVLQSTSLESEPVHTNVCTKPSPPGKLEISSVCETSVCLSWDRPTDMEGVPHTFRVTWGNSKGQREAICSREAEGGGGEEQISEAALGHSH